MLKHPLHRQTLADTNYVDNIGVTDSIGNNFLMEIIKTYNALDINIAGMTQLPILYQ
jgi:hypothetical protein